MKKRIISTIFSFIIVCMLFSISIMPSQASNSSKKQVDCSYLTYKNSSKGTTNSGIMTRGTHLMDGECSITKAGRGKIYVYAATTGNHDVDYLATVIYVDRYNKKTGDWGQIDYWLAEDVNTYYVSTSKTLTVDRGYFYRVHADHVAGMNSDSAYEEATSATDGIWID